MIFGHLGVIYGAPLGGSPWGDHFWDTWGITFGRPLGGGPQTPLTELVFTPAPKRYPRGSLWLVGWLGGWFGWLGDGDLVSIVERCEETTATWQCDARLTWETNKWSCWFSKTYGLVFGGYT